MESYQAFRPRMVEAEEVEVETEVVEVVEVVEEAVDPQLCSPHKLL